MVRAFVVGHPIRHSRSPMIHYYWLQEYGVLGSYDMLDVEPNQFAMFIKNLATNGFCGGNVTIPYKEWAFRSVDDVTSNAVTIGAVNTLIVRDDGTVLGDNTDAVGFVDNLDEQLGVGWSKQVRCALLLGAGGAARAVVVGLLARGVAHVLITNRTYDHAVTLSALSPGRLSAVVWSDVQKIVSNVDMIVNTTSLGMTGQPSLDFDVTALRNDAIVADIVYVPLETPLLRAARLRGLRTVNGLGMLLHQAVPGFAAWFGVTPEVTPCLRALIEADLKRS